MKSIIKSAAEMGAKNISSSRNSRERGSPHPFISCRASHREGAQRSQFRLGCCHTYHPAEASLLARRHKRNTLYSGNRGLGSRTVVHSLTLGVKTRQLRNRARSCQRSLRRIIRGKYAIDSVS